MKPIHNNIEELICKLWEEKQFAETYSTVGGDKVQIIDCGLRDKDLSGPDYKNARIRIGNFLFVGDIEIDTTYNNWKMHGHNINKKYNKIILHVSLFNKNQSPYVYTQDGRKVPTLNLSEFLPSELIPVSSDNSYTKLINNNKIKCSSQNEIIVNEEKLNLLKLLGVERFNKKSEKIFYRLKELKYIETNKVKEPVIGYQLEEHFIKSEFTNEDFFDKKIWMQLFYELIFEALGFSKNKNIMLKVAQNLNIEFFNKLGSEESVTRYYESAFFNVAGLIPEKINNPSGYIQELKSNWEVLGRIYDAELFDETDWYFFKMRPQNFPTLRLAGGARILYAIMHQNLIGRINQKFDEIKNHTVLMNSLRSLFVIKAKDYWSEHYIFEKPSKSKIKYLVGVSRANEIMINVLLPYFKVYFDVFGKKENSKKVLSIFSIIDQINENSIVKDVADSLGLENYVNSTIYTQGMLELFRNYCSKDKCLDCELGKKIFN